MPSTCISSCVNWGGGKKKEEMRESRKRGVEQGANKEDYVKIGGWLNAGIEYTSISTAVVAS